MAATPDKAQAAAIAAHRFGLGEATLAAPGDDPRGWLLAQLGPADVAAGDDLADSARALQAQDEYLRRLSATAAVAAAASNPSGMAAERAANAGPAEPLRRLAEADVRSRLGSAARSTRPFSERLVLFWANHFTVSATKAATRGLAGAFEREAIRPHLAGRFQDMLLAAVTHPAMLRYLDNEQSAGPNSDLVQRRRRQAGVDGRAPRISGLNENLAREVLELHTLGARAAREGVYTQADVTAFAAVLTGWRAPVAPLLAGRVPAGASPTRFDPAWHEPGDKRVLGLRYAEGGDALRELLRHLAAHPATAWHVCAKLARHVVADEPPPALVERLVAAWRASGGALPAVHRALVEAPQAWAPEAAKLKTPEEFVVSTARVLGLGARAFERAADGGCASLGQRVHAAPSPAGWPDRAEDWLGPDALWKRIEWAGRVADRMARGLDARQLAEASLGPRLTAATRQQIERAADGTQALALLLLAPEFQRR